MMKKLLALAFAGALALGSAQAQTNPGTGPLSTPKGGTWNSAFTPNCIVFGNGTGPLACANAVNNGVLVFSGAGVPSASTTLPSGLTVPAPVVSGHPTVEGVTSTGATGTGKFVFDGSPTLVTPNLGTPSAATLTNATGLPVATGIAGLGSGVATWLATPSSANLRAALTDETGTGLAYFQGGALGTPASGTLTNATGLPIATGVSGLATGVATFLATPSSSNLAAALTDKTGTGVTVFGTAPTISSPNVTGHPTVEGVTSTGATGTGKFVFDGSPVLVTPNLGTPSAATLTNATGLPIATGVSGLGTGVATALSTPSSANLRSALTDETGTGAAYFQNGDLGTPSAGVLTNATGLPTTGLVNNAVTNAKMATMATGTFKGNVSGSTAAPSDLTATQVTAALNPVVGDAGAGGLQGMVPAPGAGDAAAAKFLKADGTWAVPAGGGGGGGGMTDAERQNFLLGCIYQSKSFAGYRRGIQQFCDGYKASDGIGSGSNYSPDPTNGRWNPTVAVGADALPTMTGYTTSGVTISASTELNTAAQAAWKIADKNNSTYWQNNNGTTANTWVKADFGANVTIASYTIRANESIGSFWPTAWKLQGSTDNFATSIVDLDTKTGQSFTAAEQKSFNLASAATYRYFRILVTSGANANTVIIIEWTMVQQGTPNNATVQTTPQTADATVGNGRVLIEYDDACASCNAITLNADLTAEVTCNGGANWASATLSSVGKGQAGRKVAETPDTACGVSGTSFAARLNTLNNKNVYTYGVSLTVH